MCQGKDSCSSLWPFHQKAWSCVLNEIMHIVTVQYFIWGEDKRPSRAHFSGMREWQLACLLSCRNIYPSPKGAFEHLRGQHSYSSYNPLPMGIRFRLSIFLLCQVGQKTQFWSCFCLPDCSCRPTPLPYTAGPTQACGHCYRNANVREGPQRLPFHMWQNHVCVRRVWMCTLLCARWVYWVAAQELSSQPSLLTGLSTGFSEAGPRGRRGRFASIVLYPAGLFHKLAQLW